MDAKEIIKRITALYTYRDFQSYEDFDWEDKLGCGEHMFVYNNDKPYQIVRYFFRHDVYIMLEGELRQKNDPVFYGYFEVEQIKKISYKKK